MREPGLISSLTSNKWWKKGIKPAFLKTGHAFDAFFPKIQFFVVRIN
jgi:hypothetical protein